MVRSPVFTSVSHTLEEWNATEVMTSGEQLARREVDASIAFASIEFGSCARSCAQGEEERVDQESIERH